MKVSNYIAEFLIKHGCTRVFGYQGGAVTHMIDSFYQYPEMKFIGTYHEQAAAFAAEGYARMKNQIGVAVATSGPGATNLITGIGSAYFDSIPCLYLTGQVNTYEYKGELGVRQLGFQETDIVSIVKPITKYAIRITDALHIRYELEKALSIATSDRKGPVLLDIPMDIQRSEVKEELLIGFSESVVLENTFQIKSVIEFINQSERPVILVGGGVRLSGAESLLDKICEKLRIPVVTSLMGRDAVDNSADYFMGMIGAYGNRYANLTIANSDLIIALGTRLDSRQTGTQKESFAREAKFVRVDLDINELERKIKNDEYVIQADVGDFLFQLDENMECIKIDGTEWIEKVKQYKNRYPTWRKPTLEDPNIIMAEISKLMGPEDVICLDVGQNQMWGAQSLYIRKGQRLLTSGGMGAMGFSLPCAIGAYYSGDHGCIYAITGDGGMQMNLQELELIKRNAIPIKIIIMNNHNLGMIRHFQEMYFDSRYCGTVVDYEAPDFCKLAEAYGIQSYRVEKTSDFEKMKGLFATEESVVIDMVLSETTYVYPKLSVNHPIEEQDPLLEQEEFLSQMIVKPYDPRTGEITEVELNLDPYGVMIKQTFDSFKCKSKKDLLKCIPFYDNHNQIWGFLRPITQDYRITLPGCGKLLSTWRNENPSMSAEPFRATEVGTEEWLDKLVIDREDRILFLILGLKGEKIGHMGYSSFQYSQKCCEIDAVLKGDKTAYPGIMTFSLRALIDWGLRNLKLENITLRVFSDNMHAIEFYKRNDFFLDDNAMQDHLESGKKYLSMQLDLDTWRANHKK